MLSRSSSVARAVSRAPSSSLSLALARAFPRALGGLALLALAAPPVLAQSAEPTQRIEVTGSSIKRIQGETALPVQVLNRDDIARSGVTTVEQLLKGVTATSTLGGATVANTGAGGGQGGNNSTSLVSLRGLGSQRTLVLINGRRSAPAGGGSAVDIASIPLNAVERVEVLKDGASAVYGSDAVAGVVNFILRRDFMGAEVSATVGVPTRSGGGEEAKVSALAGFGNERYGVTLGASFSKTQPIFGSDRSFARNLNVAEQLDKTSTTAFPANVRLPNGQLRSPDYPNCGEFSFVSPLSPGLCRYDNAPFIALQPDVEQVGASLGARYSFAPEAEAYVEASLTRNHTRNTTQHVLLNGAALPAGHPYRASLTDLINTQYSGLTAAQQTQLRSLVGSAWALLPPTSPYYPATFANANGLQNQPLVLLFRSIPSGVRKTEDITDNQRLVTGVRGLLAGWDYDAGLLFSKNEITTNLTQGWAETDKYLRLVNTGVINPFGTTVDPAARQAAMDANYNGNFSVITTTVRSVDLKASRELFKLSAGAVSLALGAEWRQEKLDINPSQANRDFRIAGFGAAGVPVKADRDVQSAFVEVNVPLMHKLELNAAVRYDRYEGVGNTTNPKASLRWQPLDTLLVRASVGSGFRAPTLVDLYQPEARGITTNGQRDLIRCPIGTSGIIDCSTQFVTIGGGNPALKPEKSVSASVGFLFEPTKDYSAGLDFFNVEITDIIRTGIPAATILLDPVRYASYIRRGPADGNASGAGPIIGIEQGLTNLGKTVVGGFDVDLKARVFDGPQGRVTTRLNGTYFSTYKQENLDGSFTSVINQPSAIGIGVVLRWRHTLAATWESGPWSLTLSENYQVGYQDTRTALQPASVTPRTVERYETFDLQGSYRGFKQLKLSAGLKNMFDRNPPYTNHGGGFVGSYDLSYTDVRGRFAYVTATYTF